MEHSLAFFYARARATCAIGNWRRAGKIRVGTNDTLSCASGMRFKTSDYHMIKQADIIARSPF